MTPEPLPPAQPCRGCAAPIRWAVSTKSGKLTPLDAQPSPEGNVLLTRREGGRPNESGWYATPLSKTAALSAPGDKYVNHFATCPERARFKKEKTP